MVDMPLNQRKPNLICNENKQADTYLNEHFYNKIWSTKLRQKWINEWMNEQRKWKVTEWNIH